MAELTPTQILVLEMSEQMAQVHGAMFGVKNTKGLLSTVTELRTEFAVHVDGGRAEARKIAVVTSLVISIIGMVVIPITLALI